jgi:hypothetical protein
MADCPVSFRDDLDDCLFRVQQASDLIQEVGQPLHDDPKYHRLISRLSFLTKVIDESVERARALSEQRRE